MSTSSKPGDGRINPFGNGSGSTGSRRAAPFTPAAQTNPQRPTNNIEIDTASMPTGGSTLHADGNRGAASGQDIGVGSIGGGKPPFRLKGAG